ncbi:ornithine decarboxylase [Clavulina sp. PMI_390]|nr:ornithine decarboxylase [Clavulina sp. PMI_390]
MNEPDAERAFFVADLSKVYQQYTRWRRCLPDIEPFYAVKCNPDPYVLRLLAALGTGFDCASHGEIKQVLDIGVAPSRIIFANPCKSLSFIRHASKMGVDAMTFDNTDELYKIARTHRGARLVVRILTDDSKSLCRLGLKFGAPLSTVPALLSTARELGLNVVGVSFHVGSGCYDSNAFEDAIARAASAFEMGRDAGYRFTLLDVGGGFESPNFEATAGVLRRAIQEHFPFAKQQGVQIIAEPGRYFVAEAFQLATNIIARRVSPNGGEVSSSVETGPEQPSVMYYINDGVYGSFNCIMFDHQKVTPLPLTIGRSPVPQFGSSADQGLDKLSSVWGPTCDSIDCVAPLCTLPDGLDVGDWLGFENMGAYTICAASNFNGFDTSSVHYTSGAGAIESAAVRRALAHYNSKGSATLY